MNRKLYIFLFTIVALVGCFSSCKDDATYADQLKAEKKAINSFIKNGVVKYAEDGKTEMLRVDPINAISEEQFFAQDSTTDVSKNEYVLFASSGVYMQIVRQGSGEKLQSGDNAQVICRFHEYNISSDSLQLSNRVAAYEQYPDVMWVSNNSGSITATFLSGLMYSSYGASVPGGWTIAVPFVKLGRQNSADDEISKIRLIVPSEEGQKYAMSNIYACFYEITMQRGR